MYHETFEFCRFLSFSFGSYKWQIWHFANNFGCSENMTVLGMIAIVKNKIIIYLRFKMLMLSYQPVLDRWLLLYRGSVAGLCEMLASDFQKYREWSVSIESFRNRFWKIGNLYCIKNPKSWPLQAAGLLSQFPVGCEGFRPNDPVNNLNRFGEYDIQGLIDAASQIPVWQEEVARKVTETEKAKYLKCANRTYWNLNRDNANIEYFWRIMTVFAT